MNFLMFLCVFTHSITCFFFLLAKEEDVGLASTYLKDDQLDITQTYVKTLYWTVTTITTVGYGDITPMTTNEIIFVMFVQLMGVMNFAYLTGSITSVLMNLNRREKMLSENEINLDKWFLDINSNKKFKINTELQKNIKDYFLYF